MVGKSLHCCPVHLNPKPGTLKVKPNVLLSGISQIETRNPGTRNLLLSSFPSKPGTSCCSVSLNSKPGTLNPNPNVLLSGILQFETGSPEPKTQRLHSAGYKGFFCPQWAEIRYLFFLPAMSRNSLPDTSEPPQVPTVLNIVRSSDYQIPSFPTNPFEVRRVVCQRKVLHDLIIQVKVRPPRCKLCWQ